MGWPTIAHGGDCEHPHDVDALREAVTSVEQAWREMDSERVQLAVGRADVAVTCASAALSPEDVAGYFRVRGYGAFLAGDIPTAELSLLAARRIHPRYVLPEDLVADSHPMRKMFVTLAYRPTVERAPLGRPAQGVLVVDGVSDATSVPTERPFVFQHLDAAGAVLSTSVLEVGERPRFVEYTPPVFVDVVQPDAVGVRQRRTSRTLFIAGLSAAVVGAGGMVASAQVERDWKARPECADPEACRGMIRANLALGWGGLR